MARRLVPARPTNWPESVMAGNDTRQRHRAGGEAPGAANGWPELPPGAAWQWPAWPAGADSGRQQFPGVAIAVTTGIITNASATSVHWWWL